MTNSSKTVYHVTERKHLDSVLHHGLEPRIGERSAQMGEKVPRVYLFSDLTACEEALMGWLGECYEDLDAGQLIILEISSEGLVLGSEVEWEMYSLHPVPARQILNVLDENMEVLMNNRQLLWRIEGRNSKDLSL